jgi:hypothetical protein
VEFQQHPEFMSPDLIAPEYRREAAALHIAHTVESLLMGNVVDPVRSIYVQEHMALLGFGNFTPTQLLSDRILPSLIKNKTRVPPDIHNLVFKPAPAPIKA